MHKTTILCKFGLFRHKLTTISPSILNHFWWELYHYHYRDMIDNHNVFRMHPISLEETWMMMRWPSCVFSFILAVSIVNVQNCSFILPEQGQSGCFAIMMTHSKAAYIQPLLVTCWRKREQGSMEDMGHWSTALSWCQHSEIFSRATAEVQDKIWQMEMH